MRPFVLERVRRPSRQGSECLPSGPGKSPHLARAEWSCEQAAIPADMRNELRSFRARKG